MMKRSLGNVFVAELLRTSFDRRITRNVRVWELGNLLHIKVLQLQLQKSLFVLCSVYKTLADHDICICFALLLCRSIKTVS